MRSHRIYKNFDIKNVFLDQNFYMFDKLKDNVKGVGGTFMKAVDTIIGGDEGGQEGDEE